MNAGNYPVVRGDKANGGDAVKTACFQGCLKILGTDDIENGVGFHIAVVRQIEKQAGGFVRQKNELAFIGVRILHHGKRKVMGAGIYIIDTVLLIHMLAGG